MNDAALDDAFVADDAPSVDAPEASVGDAGVDANLSDDGPCRVERCNRVDDDCDGRIDEAGCSGCTSQVIRDHIYLRCAAGFGETMLAAGCESLGGGYGPVTLDSLDEQVAVSQLGNGWVGAFRGTDGTFRDREHQPLASDLVYADGFPSDLVLERHCLALIDGELTDAVCSTTQQALLCEAPLTNDCVPSEETCDAVDEDCDGMVDEGACGCESTVWMFGHRYIACRDPERSVPNARIDCAAHGGVLATLDTQDEGRVLAPQLSISGFDDGFWVGHSDEGHEGTWLTVDGREIPLNWRIGEPDNTNGNQNDARMTISGSINDNAGFVARPYLCELGDHIGP